MTKEREQTFDLSVDRNTFKLCSVSGDSMMFCSIVPYFHFYKFVTYHLLQLRPFPSLPLTQMPDDFFFSSFVSPCASNAYKKNHRNLLLFYLLAIHCLVAFILDDKAFLKAVHDNIVFNYIVQLSFNFVYIFF